VCCADQYGAPHIYESRKDDEYGASPMDESKKDDQVGAPTAVLAPTVKNGRPVEGWGRMAVVAPEAMIAPTTRS
jgi:hypothetical protein